MRRTLCICALLGGCFGCDIGGEKSSEPIGIVLAADGDRPRFEMAVLMKPGAEGAAFVEPLAGAVTRGLDRCWRLGRHELSSGVRVRFAVSRSTLRPGPDPTQVHGVTACLEKQLVGTHLPELPQEDRMLELQLRQVP